MFDFSSSYDEDTYKSLSSLVKYNNGVFKSKKQRKFIIGDDKVKDPGSKLDHYGIDTKDAEGFISVSAMVDFVGYGTAGKRHIQWIFLYDEFGITRQFKLKFKYDQARASVDKNKTELLWSRDEKDLKTDHLTIPDAPPEIKGKHISEPGEKSVINGIVKKILSFDKQSRFYGQSDIGHSTKIESLDGIVFVYWGLLKNHFRKVEEGDHVVLRAKIKEHSIYKNERQNTIAYPSDVTILKD